MAAVMPRHGPVHSLDWQLENDHGPCLTKHAGCILGDHMFLHGGVSHPHEPYPEQRLAMYDLFKKTWTDLTTAETPTICSHRLMPVEDRFLLSIGGWTGHDRTSRLHAYDIEYQKWFNVMSANFPRGGGLSSHSAAALKSGGFVVHGREGSLRQQRRSGHAWYLLGSIQTGFVYQQVRSMKCASRSSHHSVAFEPGLLYLVGGRDDRLIEEHRLHHEAVVKTCSESDLIGKYSLPEPKVRGMPLLRQGRRDMVVVAGKTGLLIYGGMCYFQGTMDRGPRDDFIFFNIAENRAIIPLNKCSVARAGMIFDVHQPTETLYMQGGISGRGKEVRNEVYRLTASSPSAGAHGDVSD